MELVAGVDALGRVAEEKFAAREPRDLRQQRPADVFGDTRVDRRLIDDDVALLEHLADRLARLDDGREIGAVVDVDGRGHRHHEEGGLLQLRGVGGDVERDALERGRVDLSRAIEARRELLHLRFVDVEADGAGELPREPQRDGKPDVAKPDDGDSLCHDALPEELKVTHG